MKFNTFLNALANLPASIPRASIPFERNHTLHLPVHAKVTIPLKPSNLRTQNSNANNGNYGNSPLTAAENYCDRFHLPPGALAGLIFRTAEINKTPHAAHHRQRLRQGRVQKYYRFLPLTFVCVCEYEPASK